MKGKESSYTENVTENQGNLGKAIRCHEVINL